MQKNITRKFVVTLATSFGATALSNTALAQFGTMELTVVSEDQDGKTGSLWGQQSSKACSMNGERFYVNGSTTARYAKPRLFMWVGTDWEKVWEGPNGDAKQNPSVICDKLKNTVHVIYNTIDQDLIHYRIPAPFNNPASVDIIDTSYLTTGVDYIGVGISSISSQIYLASYGKDTIASNVPTKFNILYYHDGPKKWYGPYSQKVAYENGTGWIDERSDGTYLYPVVDAYGARVFSAANFFAYASQGNAAGRKHWTFWESLSYGQDAHSPNYRDGASGSNQAYESAPVLDYFVGPKDIEQIPDGTVYVLNNITGGGQPAQSHLYSYRNKIIRKKAIPTPASQTSMYANDELVLTMGTTDINYSCDEGKSWERVLPGIIGNDIFKLSLNGTEYSVNNYGGFHVMDNSAVPNIVDAFIAPRYYVGPDNKPQGDRVDADYRHKVINARFNTSSLCVD